MNIHNSSSRDHEAVAPKTALSHRAQRARGLWAAALLVATFLTVCAATSGRGYKSKLLHAMSHKHSHVATAASQRASHGPANRRDIAAVNWQFEQVQLPNTSGIAFTSVEVGPDHKLYGGADDGRIFRFPILPDGTLGPAQAISSLQSANGGPRLLTGFCFDPKADADKPILWAAHGYHGFTGVPDWTGKITRLSGSDLQLVEDMVVHLPRSIRDHLTNQPSFGPDGALYIPQGSSSAKGAPDKEWGNREEHLLSASVLRLDVTRVIPGHPLDAQTTDGGGSYDPAAPNAPLTVYASGIRNAYDLVWASNGKLYVPNNGSCMGGNTPAGPGVPALHNVPLDETDWLFCITPGKYYGHPNPSQGHYVLNGGHPAGRSDASIVPEYPIGTLPDAAWEPAAFDFGVHASANGIIEYTGNAFGGRLNHKLLVCRYNVGCDIVCLSFDHEGRISAVDTDIAGLDGFVNPLDLVERQEMCM